MIFLKALQAVALNVAVLALETGRCGHSDQRKFMSMKHRDLQTQPGGCLPAPFAFDRLPIGIFHRLQAIGAQNLLRLQAESADLACRRYDEGQKFLQDLMSSPEDALFDNWTVLVENGFLDAVEFSARWFGVCSRFLSDIETELRSEEREIIDDLALQRIV